MRHQASNDKILRFRRSERSLHWALAVPFLLCWASALVLVLFYNPHPQRPYREVFSWLHRISGVLFAVLPLLAMIKERRDFRTHLYNVKQAWVWTIEDLRWLALMGLAAVSKRISLPEEGKFNAAEKLNFMVLMVTYPVYIVTGIAIWAMGGAFLGWLVHVLIAALATPLVLGHIFMATLNPSTRKGLSGMVSGFVDRQWAKHHYRRWYREKFGDKSVDDGRCEKPGKPKQEITVLCRSCHLEYPVGSLSQFYHTIFAGNPLICPGCKRQMHPVSAVLDNAMLSSVVARLDGGGSAQEESSSWVS